MKARSLFNIIIKVIGITFIKDVLLSVPAMLGLIYAFGGDDYRIAISELLITSFLVFVQCLLIYYLVFRTERVIDILKLEEKLLEDPIPMNVHRSTVLTMSVIIVGLLMIILAIPPFIKGVHDWYQYVRSENSLFSQLPPYDYTNLIVYAAEAVIGLLLIGNDRRIVNFIESRQRKKHLAPSETE